MSSPCSKIVLLEYRIFIISHLYMCSAVHYPRLLNSAQVMAVAMATLSDSVVERSWG